MADLIDRAALLLKQKAHADLFADSTVHDDIVRRDEATAALAEIINAPATNRWIPCSERLPEENKVVLVSTTTGYVDFAVLRWGKWFPDGYNGVAFPPNRITAWMPKPDAYEPPKE